MGRPPFNPLLTDPGLDSGGGSIRSAFWYPSSPDETTRPMRGLSLRLSCAAPPSMFPGLVLWQKQPYAPPCRALLAKKLVMQPAGASHVQRRWQQRVDEVEMALRPLALPGWLWFGAVIDPSGRERPGGESTSLGFLLRAHTRLQQPVAVQGRQQQQHSWQLVADDQDDTAEAALCKARSEMRSVRDWSLLPVVGHAAWQDNSATCVRWPTLAACLVDRHKHNADCSRQLQLWVHRRMERIDEDGRRQQQCAVDGQVASFLAQCVSLFRAHDPAAVEGEAILHQPAT